MSPAPPRPDLRPGRPRFVNSGRFTPTLIGILCAALLAISWEHGRGNVHRLTTAVLPGPETAARAGGPGGEDAIQLARAPDPAATQPQFLRATLLPGRGMNVFQLTAEIPGHGEVPLLVAPPLDLATEMLTGTGPDANGALSATVGGAILVPWAGRLVGKYAGTSPGLLQTIWLGQHLTFPASSPGSSLSNLGLLLDRGADSQHVAATLDGQSVEAVFHPGTFSGNWTSTGAVHVLVELSARSLDLSVAVQNTGTSPMPVGIGWLPYFALPSGNRAQATLSLPSNTRLETTRGTGVPTGRVLPVAGTALGFTRPRGAPLGEAGVDDTFVHLVPGGATGNPFIDLRDTAWGYGLRPTPLTANIKALRVIAPADKPWVAIGPYTNVDDPLGPQWDKAESSGITTLQPGDSLQWKVRVEVFPVRGNDVQP